MGIVFALALLALGLRQVGEQRGVQGLRITLQGDAPGDRFGAALAGIGDVDGDGRADLAVGAPRASAGAQQAGLVRVHSGSDGRELWRVLGTSAYEGFGSALAGAGDVDLDGVPDFLVGAPRGNPPSGSAFVLSGADGSVLWSWSGLAGGDRYGDAVAGPGDADGDGWPDLAIGAPYDDVGGLNAGRVELRSGRTGALLLQLSGQPFDLLGSALASPGDVDGDGRADLLVGAPLSDEKSFNAGKALLVSGRDGAVLLAVRGSGIGDQLGQRLAGLGDVDGDGRPDLGIGAPGADHGALDSGSVRVHSGQTGLVLLAVPGRAAGEMLAETCGPGDIDADGYADLLVGAPAASDRSAESGRVQLLSGRTGASLALLHGRAPGEWLGASLAALGDVDGDGRPDFALGAPGHEDRASITGHVRIHSGRAFAP